MSCFFIERMLLLEMVFLILIENLFGKGKWLGSFFFIIVELFLDFFLLNKVLCFKYVVLVIVFSVDIVGVIGCFGLVLFDVLEWIIIGFGVYRERVGWMLFVLILFGVLDRVDFGFGVYIGGCGLMFCWFSRLRRLLFLEVENIFRDGCLCINLMRFVFRLGYKVNEKIYILDYWNYINGKYFYIY